MLEKILLYGPTEKEIEFATQWNTLSTILPFVVFEVNRIGRKGYSLSDILAVRVVMSIYKCNAHAAIETLKRSPNLKAITGMNKVPSDAVVSRKTNELVEAVSIYDIHHEIAKAYFIEVNSMNLSIDSTIIQAREKPLKKSKVDPKKKGRKKKGSEKERIFLAEKERQQYLKNAAKTGYEDEFIDSLEHRCSVTGKKNSKGNQTWFIGYKAHIAVDDRGIPVSFITTGACVHDSQLAIPLLRKSMRICDFDFTLMDAGYSSSEIEEFAVANCIFPIIDFKANAKGEKPVMTEKLAYRYRKRTTVERTNSKLKECFLIEKLYSRGEKAHFDIQLAVLLLTIKKIRENLKQDQIKLVA